MKAAPKSRTTETLAAHLSIILCMNLYCILVYARLRIKSKNHSDGRGRKRNANRGTALAPRCHKKEQAAAEVKHHRTATRRAVEKSMQRRRQVCALSRGQR